MSKDLLKEAIADAKAVREAALANAKMALEEAMTPKLQSMIAAKLQEMEEQTDEAYDGDENAMEEGFETNDFGFGEEDAVNESEDQLEEDFDLSEILAELSEEEYSELEEAKKKEKEEEKEEEEEEETEEVEDEAPEAKSTEEDALKDIDALKDLIRSIIQQEMGSPETMGPGTDEVGDTVDVGDTEAAPEMGGDMDNMDMGMGMGDEEEEEDKEVNLEELLAELDALDEKKGAAAPAKTKEKTKEKEVKKPSTRPDTTPAKMEESKKLQEALKAINALKTELNEVNLLNAKLIYVNRLFKGKNLTESQKVEILASFDKATTLKEAKMLFESLSTTLSVAPKKTIKESLGFASKPMGVAPAKRMIVESNDVISRMQKLANIK
jgi:hypothetical protein